MFVYLKKIIIYLKKKKEKQISPSFCIAHKIFMALEP